MDKKGLQFFPESKKLNEILYNYVGAYNEDIRTVFRNTILYERYGIYR